ncbi:hypothetical protein GCM10018781_64380 [Kitasatospora indigofera]|uniref:Uncharacterized protein n=1 Tax=Kitasatospora indigofera TaxID=67307 RepID=A0A919L1L9_9ACTN|nr:hypothetical protein [Kitasatospora indigofera]GHH81535.1 hypothetical protein GCM10018781_64380 [Kitasatospora indigofera]
MSMDAEIGSWPPWTPRRAALVRRRTIKTGGTGIDLRVTNPGLLNQPRLLVVMFSSPGTCWPMVKTGFVCDGGELTDDQLDGIVLDLEEHTEWQVRSVARWADLMNPQEYTHLQQVDSARRTGTAVYLPFSGGPTQSDQPRPVAHGDRRWRVERGGGGGRAVLTDACAGDSMCCSMAYAHPVSGAVRGLILSGSGWRGLATGEIRPSSDRTAASGSRVGARAGHDPGGDARTPVRWGPGVLRTAAAAGPEEQNAPRTARALAERPIIDRTGKMSEDSSVSGPEAAVRLPLDSHGDHTS